jgi:hypothetical protein
MKNKFSVGQFLTINEIELIVICVPDSHDGYYWVECPKNDNMYLLTERNLTEVAQPSTKIDADYAAKADFYWSKRDKSVKMMRDFIKHFNIH